MFPKELNLKIADRILCFVRTDIRRNAVGTDRGTLLPVQQQRSNLFQSISESADESVVPKPNVPDSYSRSTSIRILLPE